jgi:hypothetical protein
MHQNKHQFSDFIYVPKYRTEEFEKVMDWYQSEGLFVTGGLKYGYVLSLSHCLLFRSYEGSERLRLSHESRKRLSHLEVLHYQSVK